MAYDMVLAAEEPLPVSKGEPLPEPAKVALVDTLAMLRTAIRMMNQGNYPHMVKALGGVVTNIGAVIHAFDDLGTESGLLQKAAMKLLRSKAKVKRTR